MARSKPNLPPDDDGRTIVRMDPEDSIDQRRETPKEPLSRRETFWIMFGALKASLLVAGFICAGMLLFIVILLLAWT